MMPRTIVSLMLAFVAGPAPAQSLSMPSVSGRSVYIDQVQDGNVANAIQTASNAYSHISQDGYANDAETSQTGSGSHYADLSQAGGGNVAKVEQGGAGQNVLYLTQTGSGNWARASQIADGDVFNAAQMSQRGTNDSMSLTQDGADNLAILTQAGSNDDMTASQLGDGNRLTWTQQGNNLSDLQITQSGGADAGGEMTITQANGGH
jgi:hypothetical protein